MCQLIPELENAKERYGYTAENAWPRVEKNLGAWAGLIGVKEKDRD